ncbi:hypothetical protein CcaverHIS002_0604870 [Cutaneotrichosporon cavernicola]|nr:hypothetical protein CcaverHIS002_0604870 [Cutaneotrichosporon cavernicola]BEJ01753.1 hypothetical protein CcaverHIS631_0604350 [Cutaneotrichosporon cavernicola]BEJ09520.1 hypothetical protein CcaverHIS641_0604350 [Cutaneotrichosporon cavernicola]
MVDTSSGRAGLGSFPPMPSDSSPARHSGTFTHRPRHRWVRPILILAIPSALIFLYIIAYPFIPSLPPPPRIRIETGDPILASPAEPSPVAPLAPIVASADACVCGVTDRGKALCNVYQKTGLRASRIAHSTGARLRRVLGKARAGNDIKVGVLGGSVSACRGVHPTPEHPEGDPAGPGCYTSVVHEYLKQTFPDSKVQLFNGALGGMDSSYYAFCGTHHIPSDLDLIVLEFDVNDEPDPIYQQFFDQLLRVLLEFKTQPAIVILGSWAPQIAQDVGYADPQIFHLPIALYYDIPYLSLKRVIFYHYARFPHSTAKAFFLGDQLHPNARGHRLLADLLIAYLESELCMLHHFGLPTVPSVEETIATTNPASSLVELSFPFQMDGAVDWTIVPDDWEVTFDEDKLAAIGEERRHFALPQTPYSIPFFNTFQPLSEVLDPSKPDPPRPDHIMSLPQPTLYCADANDPKHPMQPVEHEGWEAWDWKGEKHYWISSTIGARIRVDIKVSAGRVAISYFRSKQYDLGDAYCWVDDNESGAVRLAGYWERPYNHATVRYIDRNVTTGDHYVTCEVAKETSHQTNPDAHHFRIVAVMAT